MNAEHIINWFLTRHGEWVEESRLVSWAKKLGINLNDDGEINEEQLFHLFVLAVLWNNKPTYNAEKGEQVFKQIKGEYTFSSFRRASYDASTRLRLKRIASKNIGNPGVFHLLKFITKPDTWDKIMETLNFPVIGDKADDIKRLEDLWRLFNNPRREAYLTLKLFLIFREIKIQFANDDKYQYHPAICCVPDSHVRNALAKLDLIKNAGKRDLQSLIHCSKVIAKNFCKPPYELYDLPLFFWHKEN